MLENEQNIASLRTNAEGCSMKVFVVVGMPASGKNIARIYADSRGIPYFATGDIVREEVRKRGLEHDEAAAARVSFGPQE